jgi:Fe-S oxidoreductase
MGMQVYQYNETIQMCRFCLMCRHACTVGNVTQNDCNLPRGKALLLFAIQMELAEWDERAVQIMYQCTNCHLCREWCVPGWDIAPALIAARGDLVQLGLDPPAARQVRERFRKSGNLYGEPSTLTAELRHELDLPEKAEILYYAGCTTAHRQPEMARAALRLIQACGASFTLLDDEPCCAEPLWVLGYQDEARALANRTIKAIHDSGARLVVSSSPTCIETFRHAYREWGVDVPPDVQFLHISEYLDYKLGSGGLKLRPVPAVRVTYHDPCSLGRQMQVYDPPRRLIQALPGVEFTEMRLNRQHSPCCGNGGGLPSTDFAIAEGAGHNAGQIVMETGADVLVTACPSCKLSFEKHVGGMRVLDICELLNPKGFGNL